jgi:hypothetical protein
MFLRCCVLRCRAQTASARTASSWSSRAGSWIRRTVSDLLMGPVLAEMMVAYERWKHEENGGEDVGRGDQRFYNSYAASLSPDDRAELQAAVQELEQPTEYYEGRWEAWVECHVHDARKLRPAAELATAGFELVPHTSAVVDFADDDEVARTYHSELERLVADATGAEQRNVFVEQHTVRDEGTEEVDREDTEAEATAETAQGSKPQRPIQLVHNDFSDRYKAELMDCFRGVGTTTVRRQQNTLTAVYTEICAYNYSYDHETNQGKGIEQRNALNVVCRRFTAGGPSALQPE